MGLWARLRGTLGLSARYTAPPDPSRVLSSIPSGWIPSGLRLSQDEATSVSAVWACIQVISNAIASSPWLVYGVQGRRRTYLPDDKLAWILNQRANDEITAIAFREAMMFGAFTGGGFAEIARDSAGRVTGLLPLDPAAVTVWRVPDTGRLMYVYSQPGGDAFLEPQNVFHVRGPVTVFGLTGDSIVGRAARSIALAAAAERFAVGYLANGAVPSMVLRYPGKLDDKSFQRIREQWAERYAGPKSAGKPVVLEGNMDAKDVSADPQKAQLVPTQTFALEQIARYFGVPLVLLGVESAAQGYGVNLESMMRSFRVQTLTPWCRRLEQEANAKLLSPSPYRETVVDTSWLSRGDAKSQAEADRIRIESGVLTVNEVREEMGENTIGPEGDLRFVSNALQPLTTTLIDIQELAAKEPEPPAPSVAAPEDDTEDDATEPEGDDEEAPMLRQALRQMVLQNLERMDARLSIKFRELKSTKIKQDELDKRMEEERAKLRAEMERECYPALDLIRRTAKAQGRHLNGEADAALLAAVEAVANGKVPAAEADRMISALLPEVSA